MSSQEEPRKEEEVFDVDTASKEPEEASETTPDHSDNHSTEMPTSAKQEDEEPIPPHSLEPGHVAWAMLEGYPWWPVFICNPHKLREKLYHLGTGHKNLLRKARQFSDFRLVYYFQSHDFSSVNIKKKLLKVWDCPEQQKFLKAFPKAYRTRPEVMADLEVALEEAENILHLQPDRRVPVLMIPSDLDPTLDPPPTPEEEEDEEDDEDDEDEKDEKEKSEEDENEEQEGKKKPKKSPKSKSPKASKSKKVEKKEEDGPRIDENLDSELCKQLNEEIEKMLTHGDLSELTTRKIRKGLEEKLEQNLKEYKAFIKITVGKLLEKIEIDANNKDTTETAAETEGTPQSSKPEDQEIEEKVSPETAPSKKKPAEEERDMPHSTEQNEEGQNSTKPVVEDRTLVEGPKADALKEIPAALDNDTCEKIVASLSDKDTKEETIVEHLENMLNMEIDLDALTSSVLPKHVNELRKHRNEAIREKSKRLRKLWKAKIQGERKSESTSPHHIDPKKSDEQPTELALSDITKILNNSEASEEDIKRALRALSESSMGIDEISSVAKLVSALRSHSNADIAALAKDLRSTWKRKVTDKPSDETTCNESAEAGGSTAPTKKEKTPKRKEPSSSDEKRDDESSKKQKIKRAKPDIDRENDDEEKPRSPQAEKRHHLKRLRLLLENTSESKNSSKLKALAELSKMKLDVEDIIQSNIGKTVSSLRKASDPNVAKAAKSLRAQWKQSFV